MQDLRDRFIKAETCLEFAKDRLKRIEKEELPKYTLLSRFKPVEKIVYSACGIVLVGVVTALLNLVLKK